MVELENQHFATPTVITGFKRGSSVHATTMGWKGFRNKIFAQITNYSGEKLSLQWRDLDDQIKQTHVMFLQMEGKHIVAPMQYSYQEKSTLIPIIKKQSNNPERGSFYKITSLHASKNISVTKDKKGRKFSSS